MSKIRRRLFSLVLVFVMLLGSTMNVFAVNQEIEEVNPHISLSSYDYGPFKNVSHTISLDEGNSELCLRDLTGELIFDWPESSTYLDVVIVQDFSGSFKETIANVGGAVRSIISSLNMGVDIDNSSPKDRVMVVGYRGVDAYADVLDTTVVKGKTTYTKDMVTYQNKGTPEYTILRSNLQSVKGTIDTWVRQNYVPTRTNGGTPTTDGMVVAQRDYKTATSGGEVYNQSEYLINGSPRHRKTIYLLITDGASNGAKWNNLSAEVKMDLNVHISGPGIYNSKAYDDFDSSPGGNSVTGSSPTKTYLWRDKRQNTGAIPYYGSPGQILWYESLMPMLKSMGEEAEKIKVNGGIGNSNATFVSAFWEDIDRLGSETHGYGNYWENSVRNPILQKLKEMAHDNPDYFATSNTDINDFSEKLVKAFKTASTPIKDQIKISTKIDISPNDYTLYKKQPNGSYIKIDASEDDLTTDNQLLIDMGNKEKGTYKITYKMSEKKYQSEDYKPVSLDFIFEGNSYSIGTEIDDNIPVISKNTREDCEINVIKTVAENKDDYENRNVFKDLNNRRQEFYFDSSYHFTSKVHEAQDKIIITDTIDERLDILDAYLVAGNTAAEADAVSGSTPNNTLIAELKGVDFGDNDNVGVPELTIDGNTISYNLPEKPKVIGNVTHKFGGYVGSEYVLVIMVRIKDSVSDEEIRQMRETMDVDGKPVGIPNVAKLIIDSEGEIQSNVVKVVPPELLNPEIHKYVSRKADEGQEENWYPQFLNLPSKNDAYRYRIELLMPSDTTGYRELIIEDKLHESIEIINTDSISLYYMDGQEKKYLDESVYNIDYSNGNLTLTVIESSMSEQVFEEIENKVLYFEFTVSIKDNADLASIYNSETNRIEIPNTSSLKLNNLEKIESNTVRTYVPLLSIELLKTDENGVGLLGAEFLLVDTTNQNTVDRTYVTDENGIVLIDGLVPGREYSLSEKKAPSGYILDSDNSWTISIDEFGSISVSGGPDGSVDQDGINAINKRPESPVPEKWLKGINDADFTQPTIDDPYKLSNVGEVITYQIRVPIGDVEGFNKLEIIDTVDLRLLPKIDTLKIFTLDNPNVEIGASLNVEGRTITISKESGFEDLENKTLVIQVDADVLDDLDTIFAGDSQGKIPNEAGLKLNGGEIVPSNEVVIQATRATVTLKKTVSEESIKTLLPEGLTAGIDLYKVVENPDPITIENNDIKIGSYTIDGPNDLVVNDLEPGKYYFIETAAPIGYYKKTDMIPEGGFTITAVGGEINGDEYNFSVDNPKSTNPTISKSVRGEETEYSTSTYELEIGEEWYYALDLIIPQTADDADYIVEDEVPDHFEILDVKHFSKINDSDTWIEDENIEAENEGNKIKYTLLTNQVDNYRGKTIRVEVKVRVVPGTNLLEEDILNADGTIANTVYLKKGNDSIDDSTVYVRPTLLRSFGFTKMLGTTKALSGVTFKLHEYLDDGTVGEVVTDPLSENNEEQVSLSNDDGFVSFHNLKVGNYWMLENPPEGVIARHDKIRVIVGGIDANPAIQFQSVDGFLLSSDYVYNNELISIRGEKTWQDDENAIYTRPESIDVNLYRKLGENGSPELVDSKTVYYPWTYEFDEELLRFDPIHNEEYIYYIEEAHVNNYISEIDGFNINNRLDETNITFNKKLEDLDGNTEDLSGDQKAVFTLEKLSESNMNLGSYTADANGPVVINGLSAGWYRLTEIEAPVGYLIADPIYFVINEVDGELKVFKSDRIGTIGEEFENRSLEDVINHIKEDIEIVKDVNGRETLFLNEYSEEFTFSLSTRVPAHVVSFTKFIIEDSLEDVFEILSVRAKVNGVLDNELTELMEIEQDTVKLEIPVDRIKNYENQTIKLEINAKLKTGITPDELVKYVDEYNPIGSIPNEAVLIIGDASDQTIESNVVTVVPPQRTSVRVTKTWVNLDDGDFPDNHKATFILDQTGEEKTITGDGTVVFENLAKYDGDEEIQYTVTEKAVSGFESIVSGNMQDGFVFVNYPKAKFGVVLQKIDGVSKDVLPGAEFELWGKLSSNIKEILVELEIVNEIEIEPIDIELFKDGESTSKKLELTSDVLQGSFEIDDFGNYSISVDPQDGLDITVKSSTDGFKIIVDKSNIFGSEETKIEVQEKKAELTELQNSNEARIKELEEKLMILGEITDEERSQFNEDSKLEDSEILEKELKELKDDISDRKSFIEELESKLNELDKTSGVVINDALIEIKPFADEDSYVLIGTFTTDQNGLISALELLEGEYYFIEKVAPEGYILDADTKYEFSVPDSETPSKPVTVTVENERIIPHTTSYTVYKHWVGGPSPKPDIVIELLQDGSVYDSVTLKDGTSSHTWSDLPKYNGTEEYKYSVREQKLEGYEQTINGNIITNTWTKTPDPDPDPDPKPIYGDISGIKTWVGDSGLDRPESIIIKLIDIQTGNEVRRVTVTSETNWAYIFKDVMIKDSKGKNYEYKVEEVVPSGYTVKYRGYDIINTKTSETPDPDSNPKPDPKPDPVPVYGEISGLKTWEGDTKSDRPRSIIVKLIDVETGNEVRRVSVSADSEWKFAFTDVMIKDANGKAIKYRVEEVVPLGYTVSYNGYNVINTREPETGKPDPKPEPKPPTTKLPTTKPPIAKPPTTKPGGTKFNPPTLVEGYAPHFAAMAFTGLIFLYADLKRRRNKK